MLGFKSPHNYRIDGGKVNKITAQSIIWTHQDRVSTFTLLMPYFNNL